MEEENIDTSGFYKQFEGQLLYGPTAILNKFYELKKENKEEGREEGQRLQQVRIAQIGRAHV